MATPEFKKPPDFAIFILFCAACPAAHFLLGVFSPPETVFLSEIFLFFLPAALFLRIQGVPGGFFKVPVQALVPVLFLSLLISYVLNSTLPYWLKIFPIPEGYERTFLDLLHLGSFRGFLRDLFLLGFVPALSEEFFFRGVLQTGLCAKMKPAIAVVGAAAVFALCHLNPWYFPFYLILGIFFGAVYLKTRSLFLSVLAHFVNNALGVVLYHYF